MSKNIGVITEQGFVAGNGLGFNPISENKLKKKDLKPKTNEKSNNKDNKENKDKK